MVLALGGQSWSFSFSISPSNEYSGLISFRMDWLDLLAIQETQEMHFQSLGQEDPLVGNGNPLQHSGLENSMDREA